MTTDKPKWRWEPACACKGARRLLTYPPRCAECRKPYLRVKADTGNGENKQ